MDTPFLTFSFAIDSLGVSDNAAYIYIKRRKGPARRVLSPAGRKWKAVVVDSVLAQAARVSFPIAIDTDGVNPYLLGCTMRIVIHQVMMRASIWRRDAHNGGKLLTDSMCETIGLDDRYAVEVTLSKELGSAELTQVLVEFYKDGKV